MSIIRLTPAPRACCTIERCSVLREFADFVEIFLKAESQCENPDPHELVVCICMLYRAAMIKE